MEVDCVRPVGGNTGVSIWIDGKLRAISVSPRITDPWLPVPVSDEDRCWLVVRHLRHIQRAAADHLRRTDPEAASVFVDERLMMPLASGTAAKRIVPEAIATQAHHEPPTSFAARKVRVTRR